MNLIPSTSAGSSSTAAWSTAAWSAAVASAAALAFVILAGGPADARPFKAKRTPNEGTALPCNRPTSPKSITPCAALPEEMQHVPQPWSLEEETGSISSQPPPTALEPVPGTGSGLLIGNKVPDKITHTLDPATIAALKDALKNSLPQTPSVPITLPVGEETSRSFSRISLALEILLWLAGGTVGTSLLGKASPLVARVASGLLSAFAVASQAALQTNAVPSSPAINPSSAVNPVAPSSTSTPGT